MSLRDVMPETAAFIDAMRDVFGVDVIDASIRAGMAGHTTFAAEEAGRTVGTPGTFGDPASLHLFSDAEFVEMRERSKR